MSKKYKIESYDHRTFLRKDIETNVSDELVNKIENILNNIENIALSTLMVDPETLGVKWFNQVIGLNLKLNQNKDD